MDDVFGASINRSGYISTIMKGLSYLLQDTWLDEIPLIRYRVRVSIMEEYNDALEIRTTGVMTWQIVTGANVHIHIQQD